MEKQLNGSLVPLTDDTGSNVSDTSNHTITITNSMVNSALNLYAIFKDKNGKELTSDVQGIIDASDPLSIKLNAVPADEVIVNDDDTVVYTPNVVNSDGQVMTEFPINSCSCYLMSRGKRLPELMTIALFQHLRRRLPLRTWTRQSQGL